MLAAYSPANGSTISASRKIWWNLINLQQRASEQDVNARRAFVTLSVQRAYLNSLKRRKLVQIAEETVRERGIITGQIETLYRQQLKSKLDFDLARVELVNAQSLLVKTRNDAKASFADLNRAMGIVGAEDYVLEDVPVDVRPISAALTRLAVETVCPTPNCSGPRNRRLPLKPSDPGDETSVSPDRVGHRERRQLRHLRFQSQDVPTGGWWAAGALVSMPLFTGFMIENQVREASAQQAAAQAASLNIEQALTQQVTNAYLDTVTFAQHIKLGEEQVKTAQEALQLAKQRYKLGLGTDRGSDSIGSRADSRGNQVGRGSIRLQNCRSDPCLCLGRRHTTRGGSYHTVDSRRGDRDHGA